MSETKDNNNSNRFRAAAIDLGTNTFHLVCFERNNQGVQEIFRKRHHVFLSSAGIKTIASESINRAKNAIADFRSQLEELQVQQLQIVGTAAMRRASNGPALKAHIEAELGVEVQIISGQREAELIAKGVQWESTDELNNALIMDIGGGSVEFIHLKDNNIVWLQSFPVGVAVLNTSVPSKDPIQQSDRLQIETFIEQHCQELQEYLGQVSISQFIGCSGSFELIPSIIEGQYPPVLQESVISMSDFHQVKNRIYSCSLEERMQMDGLPPVRAELIVVAFVLMDWVLRQVAINDLQVAKYAVKEGLVAEMLDIK